MVFHIGTFTTQKACHVQELGAFGDPSWLASCDLTKDMRADQESFMDVTRKYLHVCAYVTDTSRHVNNYWQYCHGMV